MTLTLPRIFSAASVALFIAASAAGTSALAQDYPSKPVRLVVPFPPTNSGDVLARVLADKLAPLWNQPIIVDNKPGASSNIGADAVAKAAPDGYTLLVVPNNVQTMNPYMSGKMPFDPVRGFESVTLLATVPFVLVAGPSLKVNSVKELVAAAKAKQGGVTYASSGIGSNQHLMAELFRSITQTPMTHIPYKGGAPAVVDMLAGLVDMQFGAATALLPYIRSGKLTALAVTSATRIKNLPNVPTMGEAGIPGFVSDPWIGLLAPAKTPPAVIARINRDVRAVLAAPGIADMLAVKGMDVNTTTPTELTKRIETERETWSKVISQAGIRAE